MQQRISYTSAIVHPGPLLSSHLHSSHFSLRLFPLLPSLPLPFPSSFLTKTADGLVHLILLQRSRPVPVVLEEHHLPLSDRLEKVLELIVIQSAILVHLVVGLRCTTIHHYFMRYVPLVLLLWFQMRLVVLDELHA